MDVDVTSGGVVDVEVTSDGVVSGEVVDVVAVSSAGGVVGSVVSQSLSQMAWPSASQCWPGNSWAPSLDQRGRRDYRGCVAHRMP